MSADNWAVCPRCLKNEHARIADLTRQVNEGYGKLPIAEFDELRTRLAEGINERGITTFREDYELGVETDGQFYVSYGGGCDVCKLSFSFKHEEQIGV